MDMMKRAVVKTGFAICDSTGILHIDMVKRSVSPSGGLLFKNGIARADASRGTIYGSLVECREDLESIKTGPNKGYLSKDMVIREVELIAHIGRVVK